MADTVINVVFDLTDTNPANVRYVKKTGVYKVKLIDARTKKDDEKLHTIITAQVIEPKSDAGRVIENWLFSPIPKVTDATKIKAYKRQWKALAMSCGVPEEEVKRTQFCWDKTADIEKQSKEKGRLLVVLHNKYAYIDFIARETADDFDDKTFITEKQFRLFSASAADVDDDEVADTEVEEDADETVDVNDDDDSASLADSDDDGVPEDDVEQDDESAEDDDEVVETAPAEPQKRGRGRPKGSKNKPKDDTAAETLPRPAPPKGRKVDPLDAAGDL